MNNARFVRGSGLLFNASVDGASVTDSFIGTRPNLVYPDAPGVITGKKNYKRGLPGIRYMAIWAPAQYGSFSSTLEAINGIVITAEEKSFYAVPSSLEDMMVYETLIGFPDRFTVAAIGDVIRAYDEDFFPVRLPGVGDAVLDYEKCKACPRFYGYFLITLVEIEE